jgi:CheY-like chemotaxis protein
MTALRSEAPRTGRPARILIAEDDPDMRELITALVEDLGLEVVAVPDGQAALDEVAARPPDLILSDLGMPRMGGVELCRRVKADPATRSIPVVLITGIGEEYKGMGHEVGADAFLGKPFTLADLRAKIHALLGPRALGSSDGGT